MYGGKYLPKFAGFIKEHLHADLDLDDEYTKDMEVS